MIKKKKEIAAEVRQELESQPLSKLSISTVCKNMNCSRQSFYYYFKDIEACYCYYLQESFKENIRPGTTVTDVFNYFDKNFNFVKLCSEDQISQAIFWEYLMEHTCALLDETFRVSVPEYSSLYSDERNTITSFYAAGIMRQLLLYLKNNKSVPKEKYIGACSQLIGSVEDVRNVVSRFAHSI